MKRFAILGVLIVLGLSPGSSVRAQGGAPALTDSVGPVSFLVPPGWTRTVYPDGNVYASPMFNNGERCQITVFPMRHAPGGDLLQAALGTFRAMFQAETLVGYPQPELTLWRGASPLGWDYAVVRKSIRGQVGEYGSLVSVILLIAQVDSELGVVAATSKDPQVSMCLGDVARSAWAGFFYGLRYTQAHSAAPESAWRQRLAGVWTSATGTVALRYAFTPAGRYADSGAPQHRAPYWSSEVMVTTDAHFGNGRYTLQGNQIVLTPDSSGGVTRGFFRLEQESRDRGRTWADRLCLLLEGIGDVCYQRDR
jgi:hypothetical protein